MYELLFWNYKEGIYLNHHEVYEAIINNEIIDGLEEIPQQVILNRIASVFKDWDKIDENSWKNPSGKGAFQVKSTNKWVTIDCYGTEGKTMDVLANTIEEFKLPLYDPQIPVRYDEYNE
jgi:hypothetical protein